MKSSGYNIPVLRAVPYSEVQITDAFTAKELAAAQAKIDLTNAYTLRVNSYNVTELLAGGYTTLEIKEGRYNIPEFVIAGFTSTEQLLSLGFIQTAIDAGVAKVNSTLTNQNMKESNYTISDLFYAGFTLHEFKAKEYIVSELKTSGFILSEFKTLGYTVKELNTDDLYDLDELKEGGFTASDMKSSGYNIPVLREVPYSEPDITDAFTSKEIAAAQAKIDLTTAYTLRLNSYTVIELLAGGYTTLEIKEGRYNIPEFIIAGFISTEQLLGLGFIQTAIDAAAASISFAVNAPGADKSSSEYGTSLKTGILIWVI